MSSHRNVVHTDSSSNDALIDQQRIAQLLDIGFEVLDIVGDRDDWDFSLAPEEVDDDDEETDPILEDDDDILIPEQRDYDEARAMLGLDRGLGVNQEAATAERISELQRENEESASLGLRFSRACRVCYTESPRQRAVFYSCGHTACLACAEKIRVTANEEMKELECPFCREKGGFVKLFEELIESEPDIQ